MGQVKLFGQYRGLRKEIYILFWGRVVTNMGALIWPMMTLILTEKLGYTPGQASSLILMVGLFLLPGTLIGGRLADRLDKKKLIVVCDMVTVIGYLICGVLPLGNMTVLAFSISGIFAQVEWPSYDALVANLSTPEDRERAYSLNYLGGNLGLVLAPMLGGLLFENHLNIAFLVSGIATFSSTVLIFFFVHDTGRVHGNVASGIYEDERNVSLRHVFSSAPVLLLFLLCMAMISGTYSVSLSFLIPLSMESFFGPKGALLLGTLTSVNAFAVIVGTPLLTGLLTHMRDAVKLQLGVVTVGLGCCGFMLTGGNLIVCFAAMIVMSVGQILLSLGDQPYVSKRVPASHRGRISSLRSVSQMVVQGILLFAAGHCADLLPLWMIWVGLVGTAFVTLLLVCRLRYVDRRQYPLLYL